jgi:heme-degrading monooxygenase HmoA
MQLTTTPEPPYYAVIFTSIRTEQVEGYDEMSQRMMQLAAEQPGFLGVDSARSGVGITVSYWKDLASIHAWKRHTEHREAQHEGKASWYACYSVRVAKVEYAYGW